MWLRWRLLADAFSAGDGYPWTRSTIDSDDHRRRIRDLQLSAPEHVGLPFGTIWTAHCCGAVRSAAVWVDPACVPERAQQAVGLRRRDLKGRRHAGPWRRTSCSWRRRPQVRTSCSQLSAPRPVTAAAASHRRSSPVASTRHGKGVSRRDSKRRRRKMSPCTNGSGSDRTVRRSRSEATRPCAGSSPAADGAEKRSAPVGWDVRVHAEEVGRVVRGLQRCEPCPLLLGVAQAYPLAGIVAREVDVHAAAVRLQGRE